MDRYACDLLVRMAPGEAPIRDAVVDVDGGGEVVWSGPAREAPERPGTSTQHLAGIVVPGFVDVHCHTPMVLLRGAGEGLAVDRWLHQVMWPREARLTPDDVRAGMLAGGAELLAGGITTSVEMYFHGQAIAEAVDQLGSRTVVTAPVIEQGALAGDGWESQLDEMVALADRWRDHPRVDVGLGPHAAWSVSDPCLRRIAELAAETGMLVHVHLAEQEWEDAAIRERGAGSAPAYLESIGLLEGRVIAAHGVWLDDDDTARLARHDITIAHCPCSNMKHASGIAPIDRLLAAGIPVAIATDGPASHHRLDLFEEMRTAIRLARVRHGDAERFTPAEALRMVTVEAADAIGRTDLGRLTPGARADLVAIGAAEALHPVLDDDDPISRLVWAGSPAAVTDVLVEGRRVVSDGTVVTIDRPGAVAAMTAAAHRLAEAAR